MKVERISKPAIQLIGVAARTSNQAEAGPEGKIPGLWGNFFQTGIMQQPGIKPDEIYGLYTDYASDVNGEYTVVLGCETAEGDASGSGDNFTKVDIPASDYLVFTTKQGPIGSVVIEAWQEIWTYFQNSTETRTYTGDFELYDAVQFDPSNAVAKIYIAVS
ncbi:GyrI-like domain-containing protein [Paenibacillus sp. N3/727]|uniref:GyrI-like domain-containing protein n=1 Tax=Paenibacillus sp. N3/727 TaxID=2925845 RepID=UPI001F53DA33|nr:GyrI-like domain-containing protein [Paenibacillus sp. N3/727]UNK19626.1 GyrI-like domain-containing protein [Paenibacillus sp. N3/727]